jgi:hypothetical protein
MCYSEECMAVRDLVGGGKREMKMKQLLVAVDRNITPITAQFRTTAIIRSPSRLYSITTLIPLPLPYTTSQPP